MVIARWVDRHRGRDRQEVASDDVLRARGINVGLTGIYEITLTIELNVERFHVGEHEPIAAYIYISQCRDSGKTAGDIAG